MLLHVRETNPLQNGELAFPKSHIPFPNISSPKPPKHQFILFQYTNVILSDSSVQSFVT